MCDDQKPHLCSVCSMAFPQEEQLESHMIKEHTDGPLNSSTVSQNEPAYYIDIRPIDDLNDIPAESAEFKDGDTCKYFECRVCKQIHVFQGENEMRSQISAFGALRCTSCGTIIRPMDELNLPEDHKVERHRPFKCRLCGVSFALKSSLTNHEKAHAGDTNTKCPVCGETFGTSLLKYHMKIHLDEAEDKSVKERKIIEFEPLLETNLDNRPCDTTQVQVSQGRPEFSCDYCGKDFLLKSSLTNHLRSHGSGIKIKCTVCGQKFNKDLFMYHMKIHTDDEEAKGIRLTEKENEFLDETVESKCGKKKENAECKDKMRNQSEPISSDKYSQNNTSSIIFNKCSMCDKRFYTKSSCLNHEKTHYLTKNASREKIRCAVCGLMFSRDLFEYHIKIHEQDENQKHVLLAKESSNAEYAFDQFRRNENRLLHSNHSNFIPEHPLPADGYPSAPLNLVNDGKTIETKKYTSTGRIKCTVCSKVFGRHVFEYHLKIHEQDKIHNKDKHEDFTVAIKDGILIQNKRLQKQEKRSENNFSSPCKNLVVDNLNMPYCCDICGQLFRLKSSLTNHKKSHAKESRVMCDLCGQSFDRNLYPYHLKIHKDANSCSNHVRSPDKETENEPSICVKTEKDLRDTQKLSFGHQSVKIKRGGVYNRKRVTSHISGIRKCKSCCRMFRSSSVFYRHTCQPRYGQSQSSTRSAARCSRMFGFQTTVKKQKQSTKSVNYSRQRAKWKKFRCLKRQMKDIFCKNNGKVLSRNRALPVRDLKFSIKKTFKCRKCGKEFFKSYVFSWHMSLHK